MCSYLVAQRPLWIYESPKAEKMKTLLNYEYGVSLYCLKSYWSIHIVQRLLIKSSASQMFTISKRSPWTRDSIICPPFQPIHSRAIWCRDISSNYFLIFHSELALYSNVEFEEEKSDKAGHLWSGKFEAGLIPKTATLLVELIKTSLQDFFHRSRIFFWIKLIAELTKLCQLASRKEGHSLKTAIHVLTWKYNGNLRTEKNSSVAWEQ